MTRTLYDKLVDSHKVCDLPDGDMLIYVDFHMNEYTSPQAFLDWKQGITGLAAEALSCGGRSCKYRSPLTHQARNRNY